MSERSHFFDLSRKPEPTLPQSKNYKPPKVKYYWEDSKHKPAKSLTCWDKTFIAQGTERPDISVKTPLLAAESSNSKSEVRAEARKTAGESWKKAGNAFVESWKNLGDDLCEGWEKTGEDIREAWKDSGKATYVSIMQTGEHAKDARKKVAIPEPHGRNTHATGKAPRRGQKCRKNQEVRTIDYRPGPNESKSKRGKAKIQEPESESEVDLSSDDEDQARDLERGEQKTCRKHSRRIKLIMIASVLLAFGLLGGAVIAQKLQKEPENNME